MRERLPRKKEVGSSVLLRASLQAITVGEGKHAEPYIIAFHHKSDNIASKGLGTLFGFFEVEVHDEDAAYIVNFLASVAKKEYFANPRRSVEDGFETTLHKVNVALAEIAKEGNISWLGHLHGIIGAVSDGTVHFSATGDGVLSLARETNFLPISDGLAENLSEPHPLKTFTEVSSGHLLDGDVLLALSPAIWTLFTPEDIKRSLSRFDTAGFEQFLKTALINELPIAGAVIIRVHAEQAPVTKPSPKNVATTHSEVSLENVWSKQVFEKAKAAKHPPFESTPTLDTRATSPNQPPEEYTDRKTGHIYLQGDSEATPEKPLWRNHADLWWQHISRSLTQYSGQWHRSLRRSYKQAIIFLDNSLTFGARIRRSITRQGRSWLRRSREAKAAKQTLVSASLPAYTAAPIENENIPPTPETISNIPGRLTTVWSHIKTWPFTFRSTLLRQWLRERGNRVRQFIPSQLVTLPRVPQMTLPSIQSNIPHLRSWREQLSNHYSQYYQSISLFWQAQSQSTRTIILRSSMLVLITILGTVFYLNRSTLWSDPPTPVPSAPLPTQEASPPADLMGEEPLAVRLSDGRALTAPFNFEPVAFVSIDTVAFGITRDRVVNVNTQESFPAPEPVKQAVAIDDLNTLFLLGESGTLHTYTPVNKKFGTNVFPLPTGVTVAGLGSYLTYLYVLDEATNDIYRFPRVEGGFGAPTKWSKEALSAREQASFVVGEFIALIDENNVPILHERGKKTATTFAGTQQPVSATILTFDAASGDVFVLDQQARRIVRWKTDGTLLAQYFHPSFETTSHLLIGAKNTLLVVRPDGTFAFQLP